MTKQPNANPNPTQSESGHSDSKWSYLRWVLIGGVIAILGLLSASIWWPNLTERTKFFTGNLLNLVIGLAVIAQVLIYRKQWDSMREQVRIMGVAFDARLRIPNVRVVDFEEGKRPVFIVSVINEGATDARNVTLHIRVNLAEENRLALKFSHPQIVTIPAGQTQDYFVPWRTPMSQERIDAFNTSVPLQVSGFFKLQGVEQTFCYRYYPWQGKRPEGVSQFIPCDFDPGLTTVVKPKGMR